MAKLFLYLLNIVSILMKTIEFVKKNDGFLNKQSDYYSKILIFHTLKPHFYCTLAYNLHVQYTLK